MSYDVYLEVDTGGPEPMSIDVGNYTSNVSGMWSKCLTAALEHVPEAKKLCGSDDRKMLKQHGPVINYVDGTKGWRTIEREKLRLRDLQGARAGDVVALLAASVEWGKENMDELREGNPDNGWGNADGAVHYLLTLRDACEKHPNTTIYISS